MFVFGLILEAGAVFAWSISRLNARMWASTPRGVAWLTRLNRVIAIGFALFGLGFMVTGATTGHWAH